MVTIEEIKDVNDDKVKQISILFNEIFPDIDELENPRSITEKLALEKNDTDKTSHFIVLAILDNNLPIGYLIGYYFTDIICGLIEYIAILPQYRRFGYSGLLLEKFREIIKNSAKTEQINGLFCLIDDNEKIKSGTGNTIAIYWNHMKFYKVALDYSQPKAPWQENSEKNLVLLFRPESKEELTPRLLKKFLKEYFLVYSKNSVIRTLKEYKFISKQLTRLIVNKSHLLVKLKEVSKDTHTFSNPSVSFISVFPLGHIINKSNELRTISEIEESNSISQLKEKLTDLFGDGVSCTYCPKNFKDEWFLDSVDINSIFLEMRKLRDAYNIGDYYNDKFIARYFLPLKNIIFQSRDDQPKVPVKLCILSISVNHFGLVTVNITIHFDGDFKTAVLLEMADIQNISMQVKNKFEQLDTYLERLKNTPSSKLTYYPLILVETSRNFDKIREHIYALANLDNTWWYSNTEHINLTYKSNISVLKSIFVHYGSKSSIVIFKEKNKDMFKAITGYSIPENKVIKFYDLTIEEIGIETEYISEVETLLEEKQLIQSLCDEIQNNSNLFSDKAKNLDSNRDVQKSLHRFLLEYGNIIKQKYLDLNGAFILARSEMGITSLTNTLNSLVNYIDQNINAVIFGDVNIKLSRRISLFTIMLTIVTLASLIILVFHYF